MLNCTESGTTVWSVQAERGMAPVAATVTQLRMGASVGMGWPLRAMSLAGMPARTAKLAEKFTGTSP